MKINEIHLLSDDLKSTEQFYNQILDIETVYKDQQQIVFSAGKSQITFVKSENVNPGYHLAFDIPVNKLKEALEFLKDQVAILPISEDNYISEIRHWNAQSFYFYDNNGNLLELIARFDNPYESGAPFDGKAILYVSEVGIVTDYVSELAATLIEKYGLQYYSKQPPMDNFIALGDENGLFIIVDQNRVWYPTDKKAGINSLHIKFGVTDFPQAELFMDGKGQILKY